MFTFDFIKDEDLVLFKELLDKGNYVKNFHKNFVLNYDFLSKTYNQKKTSKDCAYVGILKKDGEEIAFDIFRLNKGVLKQGIFSLALEDITCFYKEEKFELDFYKFLFEFVKDNSEITGISITHKRIGKETEDFMRENGFQLKALTNYSELRNEEDSYLCFSTKTRQNLKRNFRRIQALPGYRLEIKEHNEINDAVIDNFLDYVNANKSNERDMRGSNSYSEYLKFVVKEVYSYILNIYIGDELVFTAINTREGDECFNYFTGEYKKGLSGELQKLYLFGWFQMCKINREKGASKTMAGIGTFGWKKDVHLTPNRCYIIGWNKG